MDNLRYTWQQLLSRAMGVNTLLLEMQPAFQEELQNNLEKFRLDSEEYCLQYRTSGPMSPGLSPREASDRLIMFQVKQTFSLTHKIIMKNSENSLSIFLHFFFSTLIYYYCDWFYILKT